MTDNWRRLDADVVGDMIFYRRECPECYMNNKTSYVLYCIYDKKSTWTCINCRFDTNDI